MASVTMNAMTRYRACVAPAGFGKAPPVAKRYIAHERPWSNHRGWWTPGESGTNRGKKSHFSHAPKGTPGCAERMFTVKFAPGYIPRDPKRSKKRRTRHHRGDEVNSISYLPATF